MGLYFGPEVDEKIAEFCASTDKAARDVLFEKHIQPALMKLIENHMYMSKYYKIDDPDTLKKECLSNLYEVLPKFDPSKGKKAFSYFNVVVRHWFIWKGRERSNRLRKEANNFLGIDHEIAKNNPSIIRGSHQDDVIEKEFWVGLFRDMDKWRHLLKKEQERKVLDAIIFMLQNTHLVSIYNKKAVFLYIREMTDLSAKQVNHNMNRLKELYMSFRKRFHDGEEEGNG